jgi:hypothetical protein
MADELSILCGNMHLTSEETTGILGCATREVTSSRLPGATSLLGPTTWAKPATQCLIPTVAPSMRPGISLWILTRPLESLVLAQGSSRWTEGLVDVMYAWLKVKWDTLIKKNKKK